MNLRPLSGDFYSNRREFGGTNSYNGEYELVVTAYMDSKKKYSKEVGSYTLQFDNSVDLDNNL